MTAKIKRDDQRLNKITIMGKPYTINYFNRISDVDSAHMQTCTGQVNFVNKNIRLFDDGETTSREEIFETLLHEILHVVVDELHIFSLITEENTHDEVGIDSVVLGLFDTLSRNDLINWSKFSHK